MLISRLFYFLSSLRRGDQSTVFSLVSFDFNWSRSPKIRHPSALVCRCGLADIRRSENSSIWQKLRWVPFGRSAPGSLIQDYSDHGAFKEPMNSWSEWIRRLLVHHDPGDDPWSIDPDPLHPREINPYLLWTGLTLWITTDFLPPCPAKYEQELAFEYLESWKTFYNFWQRNSLLVVEGNVEEGETRQYHDWDFCEFSFAQNTCSTQSNNKGLFLPALCLMFFKFKLLVKEQHNVRRQKEITTLLMVTSRSPCRLKKN